jgi:hypothetical protein
VDDYNDLDDHDDHDDQVATNKLFTLLVSGAIHGGIKVGNQEEPNESARKFFDLSEQAKVEFFPRLQEGFKGFFHC